MTASLKGLSSKIVWLKVVSTDRSLFKGEAPRFSADFVHPFSSEMPLSIRATLFGPWELIE
jgi:hypothetical protein